MARFLRTDADILDDPTELHGDVTTCKAMLDQCRARHTRCPSTENATAVEEAQTRLNVALDRLPR